jgi:hypothetical protein
MSGECWIEWVEPFGPNNEPVYMRVSESTAIAAIKAVAAKRGHVYADDNDALEDFIAVNWATRLSVGVQNR